MPSILTGTDGLAGILDHADLVSSGDLIDRIHLGALTEEVHGNDRLGPFRNGPLQQRRIHIEIIRANIDEHRLGPKPGNRPRRGKEGKGHRDHFIAGFQVKSEDDRLQGFCSNATTRGPRIKPCSSQVASIAARISLRID